MRHVLSEAAETASDPDSTPAPVGGWNARDSLARMRDSDAVILDNWFPSATEVVVRDGSDLLAEVAAGDVESLLSCSTQAGETKLFACTDANVYDTAAPLVSKYSGVTSGRVEALNLNISDEPWLWCCVGNGVDDPFLYKSSTDTFQVLNGGSTPALTGITPSKVTNVSLWKSRVILTEKDSLSFWYLGLASVGGAATEFPLGSIFKRGGYLVATANWSLDAGDGPDDRFVAISSEGEVAVYQGTDPSAASTFALVGVYFIGKPIGKRCCVQIGGDLAILTEQGLWPLSRALESSTIDRKPALTDKIRNAFNAYFKRYGTLFGWQPVLYPAGPALLVNIPITATISQQFVMNTITGSWTRFRDWNARCFCLSGGQLFFAQGQNVYQAWTGMDDAGAAISVGSKQAFTYGRFAKGRLKHVKLVRPLLESSQPLRLWLGIDVDFQNQRTRPAPITLAAEQAEYDTARWDLAAFASAPQMSNSWYTVPNTPGKAWSLRMRFAVRGMTVRWAANDYITEAGGLFG
jgi:hypothetical protein